VTKLPDRVLKKKSGSNKGLPMIKCCCGVEILLVPNVKLMSDAIEAHLEEHKKKILDPKEAEAEAERVRTDLITKVLDKACET
jgi:hypothetical protein